MYPFSIDAPVAAIIHGPRTRYLPVVRVIYSPTGGPRAIAPTSDVLEKAEGTHKASQIPSIAFEVLKIGDLVVENGGALL